MGSTNAWNDIFRTSSWIEGNAQIPSKIYSDFKLLVNNSGYLFLMELTNANILDSVQAVALISASFDDEFRLMGNLTTQWITTISEKAITAIDSLAAPYVEQLKTARRGINDLEGQTDCPDCPDCGLDDFACHMACLSQAKYSECQRSLDAF